MKESDSRASVLAAVDEARLVCEFQDLIGRRPARLVVGCDAQRHWRGVTTRLARLATGLHAARSNAITMIGVTANVRFIVPLPLDRRDEFDARQPSQRRASGLPLSARRSDCRWPTSTIARKQPRATDSGERPAAGEPRCDGHPRLGIKYRSSAGRLPPEPELTSESSVDSGPARHPRARCVITGGLRL